MSRSGIDAHLLRYFRNIGIWWIDPLTRHIIVEVKLESGEIRQIDAGKAIEIDFPNQDD